MFKTVPSLVQPDCREVSEILGRVGDKWTVLIIMALYKRAQRFNAIKRSVNGISQQMLTRTLKALERDGMVRRTVYPTLPPQVEYELTELGRPLSEPVAALGKWAQANLDDIKKYRQAYDSDLDDP